MDVEIQYLPIGSHSYVENHNCHFTISSFQNNRGFLTSPQHSLPDRTTCTYILQGLFSIYSTKKSSNIFLPYYSKQLIWLISGAPGEIVWISLLKFYIGPQHGKSGDESGGSAGSTSYASSIFSSSVGGSSGTIGSSGGGGSSGTAGIISNSPDCNATYLQIWQGTYGKLRKCSIPDFQIQVSSKKFSQNSCADRISLVRIIIIAIMKTTPVYDSVSNEHYVKFAHSMLDKSSCSHIILHIIQ